MRASRTVRAMLLAGLAVAGFWSVRASTQEVLDPARNPLPNPNPTIVKNWGEHPDRPGDSGEVAEWPIAPVC